MNLDDETYLSAYLDGELDPATRLRIEAALEASPRLSERLGELAAVRTLLGSLPRPTAGADLAPAVLARVAGLRPGGSLPWMLRSPQVRSRLLTMGAGLAAAAALLVALRATIEPAPVGPPAPLASPAAAIANAAPPPAQPPRLVEAPAPVVPIAPAVAPPQPSPGERVEDRRLLGALLDRQPVRRLVVPVASLSPGELSRIEQVLADTPRQDAMWGELRLDPGLVLDEGNPAGAVLYLALLDGREINRLRANLRNELGAEPPAVELVAPELLTQLCDVGTIRFPGPRAASVLDDPPAELPAGSFAHHDPSPLPDADPADHRESPPVAAAPASSRIESIPDSDPRRLYVIWVTRSDGR